MMTILAHDFLSRKMLFRSWYFVTGLSLWLAGKESTCNAGDPSSIPGLGRSPGEGKGYPLQYSGPGEFCGLCSPWGHKESDTTFTFTFFSL